MLFDSLGLDGFNFFIVDNDEKIIDQLLFNFKKRKSSLTDQTLTLCGMKFSVDSWKNMTHTQKTAEIFFIYYNNLLNLQKTNDMSILILVQPV